MQVTEQFIANYQELHAKLASLTLSVPGVAFSYQVSDAGQFREYRFYTAECTGEVFTEADDRTLVDAPARLRRQYP